MPSADFDSNNVVGFTQPKMDLLELYRCKISLHHAKSGYDYPTIRLPHTCSKLAGLSARVYQTVHGGALAFLVVISPAGKTSESPETSVFTRLRSPIRIRPSPSFFCQSETFKPFTRHLSSTRIMAKKKHKKDKKSHNPSSACSRKRDSILRRHYVDLSRQSDRRFSALLAKKKENQKNYAH